MTAIGFVSHTPKGETFECFHCSRPIVHGEQGRVTVTIVNALGTRSYHTCSAHCFAVCAAALLAGVEVPEHTHSADPDAPAPAPGEVAPDSEEVTVPVH